MRLLLDTHTFLWFVFGDPTLSATAKSLLEDPDNDMLLSIASPWEMAIKLQTGKLTLFRPIGDFLREYLPATRARLLPISLDHVAIISTLPLHHRDPFDRMIISQAIVENIVVISNDPAFDAYPITRRW